MSHRRLRDTLRLALRLAGSSTGLTIEAMAASVEVSRKTAERYRNDLQAVFGLHEVGYDDHYLKLWRLPEADNYLFLDLEARHLESLTRLGELGRTHNLRAEAADAADVRDHLLRGLRASLPPREAAARHAKLETDLEAQLVAPGIAHRPGPREQVDDGVLSALRHAILARRKTDLIFKPGDDLKRPPIRQRVHPLGILLGTRRRYLVAFNEFAQAVWQFRLSRIESVATVEEPFTPPTGFSLAAWLARSFGVFQEEPVPIHLRVLPPAAVDAATW